MGNPHEGQPVATKGTPLGESRRAVVMLHGRGRDTEDILDLADRIGDDTLSYLAPAAEGASWYPQSFLEPLERNEPRLSGALEVIDALVRELRRKGYTTQDIFLAGFSQGACLAAEYAARNAARYGGLLIFTGGLIGPPGTEWEYKGSFGGTPVFLGTSDVDEFVPEPRVRETARVLQKMEADVTLRVYTGMEHLVNDDEILAAKNVLKR